MFLAPPQPKTMTKEYQEQSTEYLRNQNANPIVSACLTRSNSKNNVLKSPVRYLVRGLQRKGNGPLEIGSDQALRALLTFDDFPSRVCWY